MTTKDSYLQVSLETKSIKLLAFFIFREIKMTDVACRHAVNTYNHVDITKAHALADHSLFLISTQLRKEVAGWTSLN